MNDNLERAKAIAEVLEESGLPSDVKAQVVMGVSLGVDPDLIIGGAVSALSQKETIKAELENPKSAAPSDYTKTEQIIADMLVENTGAHIMDSGGAYGRRWQKNRGITDFRELPEIDVTTWKDGSSNVKINLFHFLTAHLEVDELAESLQTRFMEFADLAENRDVGWLALMEEFAELLESEAWTKGEIQDGTWNTYNFTNLLSQVIQGVSICFEGDEYDTYVMLQIHGGCDVRGGYTAPKIFKILDRDYFWMHMSDINATCDCAKLYSDDSGYNWYDHNAHDGEELDDREEHRFPKRWKPVPKHPEAKNWEYDLTCERCGKVVDFWVCMEW